MHMVIRVLVYAEDAEEAMGIARGVADELCENQEPFDYWTDFMEEGGVVAGKDRRGEILAVQQVYTRRHKCESRAGLKFVMDGMKAIKREFNQNLKTVRAYLTTYGDEELFKEKKRKSTNLDQVEIDANELSIVNNVSMFRYYCHCLGQYRGSEIWLYDQEGSGLRTPFDLWRVLEHNERSGIADPRSDMPLWVIPFDVHF